MQVSGAVPGVISTHRRRWPNVVLAIAVIAVIAAMVASMVLAGTLTTSSAGAENVSPRAASATLHEDASKVSPKAASVTPHHDAGNLSPRAASVLDDDAGN